MAEKDQQVYPMPQNNGHTKRDEEAAPSIASKDLRRKKQIKCLLYVVAFIIFQSAVIALFAMTIMKFRTPKYRVQSITLDSNSIATTTNSSFDIQMNAQLGVKNTNFGPYKFDNSTIDFYYKGTKVGEAFVPRGKVGLRSTKKVNVVVSLASTNVVPSNSGLGNDISTGVLQLTTQSELKGKVTIMFIMKKKKSTKLDCTMTIKLADKAIQDLNCS